MRIANGTHLIYVNFMDSARSSELSEGQVVHC